MLPPSDRLAIVGNGLHDRWRKFYAPIFNMADVQATVDIISALKIRELDSGLKLFRSLNYKCVYLHND